MAEKNLKNIKQEFKEYGIFYTSTELAEMLKSYIDFQPKAVYDPTCGQGNLLAVFDNNIPKYGQELYADELEKAKERLQNFNGFVGDTLKNDGFADLQFDCIVANPPFSIKWEQNENDKRFTQANNVIPPTSKADYAFMLHILWHLADKGKAVVLEFPGILYRGQREGKIRQWLIEQNYIERVVSVPPKMFVDTAIATCIIVLNKNKNNTDIIFEDKDLKKEYKAAFDEVAGSGFNLSVSTYIQEEIQKEEINIREINEQLTNQVIKMVVTEIKLRKMLAELDDDADPTNEIIERIQKELEKLKE